MNSEKLNKSQDPLSLGWAIETMIMINKLTPDIKHKAFDPGWFLLKQRLEEAERLMNIVKK